MLGRGGWTCATEVSRRWRAWAISLVDMEDCSSIDSDDTGGVLSMLAFRRLAMGSPSFFFFGILVYINYGFGAELYQLIDGGISADD